MLIIDSKIIKYKNINILKEPKVTTDDPDSVVVKDLANNVCKKTADQHRRYA